MTQNDTTPKPPNPADVIAYTPLVAAVMAVNQHLGTYQPDNPATQRLVDTLNTACAGYARRLGYTPQQFQATVQAIRDTGDTSTPEGQARLVSELLTITQPEATP